MSRNCFSVWILFALGFLDFFAVSIIIPLLAVNFNNKGYSPFLYGLAGTTYATIQTISAPVLGSYSDTEGRKKYILLSFYLSGLAYGGFFLFDGVVEFFALRSILGLFKHSNSLCKSYLCDITPDSELATAIGRFNAISSAGFIIGPLIGAQVESFEYGCLLTAGLFLLSGVFAQIFLPERVPAERVPPERVPPEPTGSKAATSRNQRTIGRVHYSKYYYWRLLSARLCCSLAFILYRSNLSFLLIATHSLTGKQIGYMMSLSGVVAAASGVLAGPIAALLNVASVRLLAASSFMLFGGLCALCLASSVLSSLVVITLVCTMASSLIRVYGLDAVLSVNQRADVGLLQGVLQSVASVSRGSAPLIAGILQQLHKDLPAATAAFLALIGTLLNTIDSIDRAHVKLE